MPQKSVKVNGLSVCVCVWPAQGVFPALVPFMYIADPTIMNGQVVVPLKKGVVPLFSDIYQVGFNGRMLELHSGKSWEKFGKNFLAI